MEHDYGTRTPPKRSSVSYSSESSSKHLAHMNEVVGYDIRNAVFSGFDFVSFIDKLYPQCDRTDMDIIMPRVYNAKTAEWAECPKDTTEESIILWLGWLTEEIVKAFGSDKARSRIRSSGHSVLSDSDTRRKPDAIFIDRTLVIPCSKDDEKPSPPECRPNDGYCTVFPVSWRNVRVVGELKQNFGESGSLSIAKANMVITLAHRVREIFGNQPGRRYVHAFSLCGSFLRCFLFDRSGVVASEHADIQDKPELLVRVLAAYLYGPPDWIGFDPTIKVVDSNQDLRTYDPTTQEPGNPFIEYKIDGNPTRLYLDPERPLFLAPSITSRGTVCWRARRENSECDRWEFVVKDQWRNEEREHEGVYLKLLNGMEGITQMEHFEDVMVDGKRDDTEHAIRRDLDFRSKSVKAVRIDSQYPSRGSGSVSNTPSPGTISPHPPPSGPPSEMRYNIRSSKRAPPSDHGQRSQTPKRTRHVSPNSPSPYNRIHGRLVLRDVGRRLRDFRTRKELLLALRSAVRGYQNMLERGIMHRDVSINNVMISSSGTGGYLIDLDFAESLDRQSCSGAPHRIGTPEFMAVQVLRGRQHAPRHDLESFFYVLLWVYTKYPVPGEDALKSPELGGGPVDDWAKGSYAEMAAKKGIFYAECETCLDDEYFDHFYNGWIRSSTLSLVSEWWELLFIKPPGKSVKEKLHDRINKVTHYTPSQPESDRKEGITLSEQMIRALDEALKNLEKDEAPGQRSIDGV